MGVPKSLDYKDYMSKSTSANPTTWDDMYRFFGNQGEITAALVKSLLYQPDTAYSIGAIVYSPNLPAGTIAKCTLAGTTGSTEPVWPAAGSAANDGTVRWLVENSGGSNITVDATLDSISSNAIANKAVYAALNNKLDKTGIAAYATRDNFGNIIADTYAKKSEVSGVVKSVNNITPDSNGNVTITVSGGGGGSGSNITVDSALSSTSTNAIQNRVVQQEFTSVRSSIPTKVSQLTNDNGYLTQHQSLDGYVKSVNNTKPDASGNVTITVSGGGGVSTSESNTWTGKQTFQKMKFNFESYNAPRISGAIDNPSESVAVYNVQGDFTLDMSELAGLLSNGDATVFTAYITANGSYTLSITNAGTLKYAGSATDLAITAKGLLLNIMLIKSSTGVLLSVAQASTLS